MIRKIVDFQKLTDDVLQMLVQKYPDGYDDDDIITFRNANNELIHAVEVRSEEIVYLVKIGVKLEKAMEDFIDQSHDMDGNDDADLDIDISLPDSDENE
jgi:DNA-directed RNA polymerase subunit delta